LACVTPPTAARRTVSFPHALQRAIAVRFAPALVPAGEQRVGGLGSPIMASALPGRLVHVQPDMSAHAWIIFFPAFHRRTVAFTPSNGLYLARI
jgi:hypothetical protein